MIDREDEAVMLFLAHKWKRGDLGKVHPSVGRLFNRSLLIAGEEAVPFARATDRSKPSVTQLLREQLCASERPIRLVPDLTGIFAGRSEQERAYDGR